jgi:hypothetical protein
MPRRTTARCSRRHAAGRPDRADELCLVWGHCFGVAGWERPLQSQAELSRLWTLWGAEITRRWVEAFPGSRPAAAYLVGQIEPPAWRHELPALRHPVQIGTEVVIEDIAWHCREIEFSHLNELGLVADEEHAAALARLAGPQPTTRPYETLARS